jgi:lipocalin
MTILSVLVIFLSATAMSFAYYDFTFNMNYSSLPPATVKELDPKAYAGFWYQMYSSYLPNTTDQKNAYCITHEYCEKSPTEFTISAAHAYAQPNGEIRKTDGYAYRPDENHPGKWVFNLNGREHPHWIIKTGPINADSKQYAYAVVTTPLGVSSYIYARDPETFRSKYQHAMLDELKKEGYWTPYNSPMETYQGPDCNYVSAQTCPAD